MRKDEMILHQKMLDTVEKIQEKKKNALTERHIIVEKTVMREKIVMIKIQEHQILEQPIRSLEKDVRKEKTVVVLKNQQEQKENLLLQRKRVEDQD